MKANFFHHIAIAGTTVAVICVALALVLASASPNEWALVGLNVR
jgi:hypothetical protein